MTTSETSPSNRLASEASAYLRQHMTNPVDWYPWGSEALEKARNEDKPLFVSIGYSACHWCHVMEHESFENEETAQQMNRDFVNIKVDREERPDVDQIYMDTIVSLNGQGGWPLSVFCTPDGRPFYGGTYYPPEPRHGMPAFREVLTAITDAYRNQRDQVETMAERILGALSSRGTGQATGMPGAPEIETAAKKLLERADTQHGGFGDAPKFPTPTQLEFLLCALDFTDEDLRQKILHHCTFTAHQMARSGLYDHVGGGFHRYCVDRSWTIPHFEKMLYDQGLLLRSYMETWRRGGSSDPDLLWPVRETAEYLRREMAAEDGGYFASQDADSEGEEGLFYVWSPPQIDQALGAKAADFRNAYGVTERGNFEHGTTHLIDRERAARSQFEAERETLRQIRSRRIAPATDHKRVASWNGYAISGLAKAASLLADPNLLEEATRAADFVIERMSDDEGRLLRVYNEGRAQIGAFLDDHASLLDACLELHRAGAGDRFLKTGLRTASAITQRFFDPELKDFFFTASDGEPLAFRPRSDHDGATPHASGLAALGLLRIGELSGETEMSGVARSVIGAHASYIERQPEAFPTLLRAVALDQRGLGVAVILGAADCPRRRALADRARKGLAPDDVIVCVEPGQPAPIGVAASWLLGREPKAGQSTAFLCRGTTCSLPVTTPEDLGNLL